MSDSVKLSAALPADLETNGLDALALQLVEEPEEIRIGVVHFDVVRTISNTDSGDQVPVVRLRRFEPIGRASEVGGEVRGVVEKAIQQRTGRRPIPFEAGHVEEGYDPDQRAIDDED